MLHPLLSLFIALAVLMIISKWDLGISMLLGGILLGLFTGINLFESFMQAAGVSIVDSSIIFIPSKLFLAFSVALIPILGGIMQDSGLMIELIHKLNVPKKAALMLSPALFGLMPMPGGALMSAPLVDEVDPNLNPNVKVAINVWYRHVLIMIYPISSAMIVVSTIANIPLYSAVASLLIPAGIMVIVGYITLLRDVEENKETHIRDLKIAIRNFFPIILTVIIDFIGRFIIVPLVPGLVPELFLLIGLSLSIGVVLILSKRKINSVFETGKKMKVWKYPILIYAMFFFLDVFENSGVPEFIGEIQLPFVIFLFVAFFLGFATGRVQLPNSICMPIFMIQYALTVMPLLQYSMIYFAIFMAYLITPIHPCVSYSLKYFKTDYVNSFKYIFKPTIICFGILIGLAALFGLFNIV